MIYKLKEGKGLRLRLLINSDDVLDVMRTENSNEKNKKIVELKNGLINDIFSNQCVVTVDYSNFVDNFNIEMSYLEEATLRLNDHRLDKVLHEHSIIDGYIYLKIYIDFNEIDSVLENISEKALLEKVVQISPSEYNFRREEKIDKENEKDVNSRMAVGDSFIYEKSDLTATLIIKTKLKSGVIYEEDYKDYIVGAEIKELTKERKDRFFNKNENTVYNFIEQHYVLSGCNENCKECGRVSDCDILMEFCDGSCFLCENKMCGNRLSPSKWCGENCWCCGVINCPDCGENCKEKDIPKQCKDCRLAEKCTNKRRK